jgi:hypothetical protein
MQLIAGRGGQEYNQRKGRHGAFWEDRYDATAIEINEHLQRRLVYIDLNMVLDIAPAAADNTCDPASLQKITYR